MRVYVFVCVCIYIYIVSVVKVSVLDIIRCMNIVCIYICKIDLG